MSSFTISFVLVIIFLAISSNHLFGVLNGDSGWIEIALAGLGFVIFLTFFLVALVHIYKAKYEC